MRNYSNNRGGLKITIVFLFLVSVFFAFYFTYKSKIFEMNKPNVVVEDSIFWNLISPLKFDINDDTGIKFVKVYIKTQQGSLVIYEQKYDDILKHRQIEVKPSLNLNANESYSIFVEVSDISKWNFFMGNKTVKKIDVKLDLKKPEVYVINNSYSIKKGGSAIVIFRAKDDNLDKLFIQTPSKEYNVIPFVKQDYYAAIIAWPTDLDDFWAKIYASDSAGNLVNIPVRFYIQNRKFKESSIELTQKFIDGKISDLAQIYSKNYEQLDSIGKFKFVNEDLRAENENNIKQHSTKFLEKSADNFNISPFYPLKNGQVVASFGDHRFYSFEKSRVSQSWHLGIDFASVANAPIVISNNGVVTMVEDNGIYGLNIIVYHGFGVYSLYAHCSNSKVNVGDEVKAGDVIGHTGSSGLAFGDHLHFGVLVQGVEVYPQEWMDKNWLKVNIFDLLKTAKDTINK